MLAYATQICVYWSQSITNKVVRASKAIYDFVIFVGCEIGKHNYTIQVFVYDRMWRIYCATYDKGKQFASGPLFALSLQALWLLLYGWLLYFCVNVIVGYQEKGCVLCVNEEVDRI